MSNIWLNYGLNIVNYDWLWLNHVKSIFFIGYIGYCQVPISTADQMWTPGTRPPLGPDAWAVMCDSHVFLLVKEEGLKDHWLRAYAYIDSTYTDRLIDR